MAMILTCPECYSRFLLPSAVLGEEGRKVRCANCAHIWFEKPATANLESESAADPIPEGVRPTGGGHSLPARGDENLQGFDRVQIAIGAGTAFAVLLLGLLGFVAFKGPLVKSWPASAAFYQALGLQVHWPGSGLTFQDFDLVRKTPGLWRVEGTLTNTYKSSEPAFPLKIEAYGPDTGPGSGSSGTPIKTWNVTLMVSELDPGASIRVEKDLQDVPEETEWLKLRFTHSRE